MFLVKEASLPGFLLGYLDRFPKSTFGEGNGNLLKYSCMDNPTAEEPGVGGYSPWGRKELDVT